MPSAPLATKEPLVSVIVSSFNGAGTITACIEALRRQSFADRTEIIVVDDGSSDATAEIADAAGVRVIRHEKNLGLSAARNSGIRAAKGAIIAFTDDDCVPSPEWLARLVPHYERDEVAGVGGAVSVVRPTSVVHRYLEDNNPLAPLELELARGSGLAYRVLLYLRRPWMAAARQDERAVYSFAGANMSFRREVLDAVGMFDPSITFGADDEYICSRVRESFPDQVLWFDPDASVGHDYAGTMRDVLRRNFAYGNGHARDFLRDPEQRWPIVFPIPVAVLVGVLVLRRLPRILALLLAVQLLLPQGILGTLRHRRLENLLFSYVRLAEESAHDLGMVVGLAGGRSAAVARGRAG